MRPQWCLWARMRCCFLTLTINYFVIKEVTKVVNKLCVYYFIPKYHCKIKEQTWTIKYLELA